MNSEWGSESSEALYTSTMFVLWLAALCGAGWDGEGEGLRCRGLESVADGGLAVIGEAGLEAVEDAAE